MFRRKRSSSTSQVQSNQDVTSSAASAAALAFLKKQSSDANLSSAAAAAALRSHTTTPEPVGSLQTKRMVRRGSVSSYGSPHGSFRQPFSSGLQRGNSNASSMADRTFRSPSPSLRNAAPLASIPDDIPPIPQKSTRRPASAASMTRSPPVIAQNTSNVGKPVARAPPSAQSNAARRSVNFSRPMSPPPAPSARMVHEQARTRPASSLGFRQNEPTQRGGLSIAATVRSQNAKGGIPASKVTPRAGPAPALAAASIAARETSSASHAPPAPVPSARALALLNSMPPAPAPPPKSALMPQQSPPRASSRQNAIKPAARPTSPPSQATRPQPPAISTSELNIPKRVVSSMAPQKTAVSSPSVAVIPSPTQEQIRIFQTRAAAHLARPLSQAVPPENATASQEPRRSASTAVQPTAAGRSAEQHSRSASHPVGFLQPTSTTSDPSPSTSPTRPSHAHFSKSPMLEVIRHQPLPRAASPAKSALKSSSRGTSPVPPRLPGTSDNSDTRSTASEEGNGPSAKKKKSVRVSFDEQPDLVGVAAVAQSPTSNVLSPQYAKADDRMTFEDTTMTPRPLLPSFGSVRGSRSPTNGSTASETLPAVSAPVSKTTIDTWAPPEAAGDQATGSVLAHDFAEKRNTDKHELEDSTADSSSTFATVPSISVLPATPKLDDEYKQLAEGGNIKTSPGISEPASETTDSAKEVASMFTPISVGQVADSLRDPEHTESAAGPSEKAAAGYESDDTAELYEDAAEEPSELEDETHGFASLDAIIESPVAEAIPMKLSQKEGVEPSTETRAPPVTTPVIPGPVAEPTDEEDWERVRAYWSSLSVKRKQQIEQDAAKHLDEQQEGASSGSVRTGKYDPHTENLQPAPTGITTSETSLPPWPDQEYQKSINGKAANSNARIVEPAVPRSTAAKSSAAKSAASKQTPQATHQRTGSEPVHMKSSMRANPSSAPTGALRTSLRDSGDRHSRPSSAASGSIPISRPKSMVTSPSTAAGASSATAVALARTMAKPDLTRKDSSGSESSFRRKRTGNMTGSDTSRYSMKKSMRRTPEAAGVAGLRPTSPTPSRSSRLSLRSPSPSLRNSKYVPPRGSDDTSMPTLRGSQQRPPKTSSSFLGLGKSSKQKAPSSKSSAGFRSRFGDSSDEEDSGTTSSKLGFRSRFDDSDDDGGESPTVSNLRPVRGIPRKAGHASGDSTDLSDSDDDARPARLTTTLAQADIGSHAAAPATPTKTNGIATQGATLSAGTLRGDAASAPSSPSSIKSKRGLFGFGKRRSVMASIPGSPKVAESASPATAATSNGANSSTTVMASQTKESPTPSPAPMTLAKTERNGASTPTGDRSRKIFRRFSSSTSRAGSPSRLVTNETFAHPVPPIPDEYQQINTIGADRPNTSDGLDSSSMRRSTRSTRPTLGDKRASTMTAPDERTVIVSQRSGKPKKFQGLRRLLKVHD